MNPETDLSSPPYSITDELAAERTILADERTFLAYTRTALTSLMSGLTIVNFFKTGALLTFIAWLLIILGLVLFIWGTYRYFRIRRLISRL